KNNKKMINKENRLAVPFTLKLHYLIQESISISSLGTYIALIYHNTSLRAPRKRPQGVSAPSATKEHVLPPENRPESLW
ncbi:hypothetical protein ACFEVR_004754, partial [Salmonella enterica subsp. enterica serovar Rissen]